MAIEYRSHNLSSFRIGTMLESGRLIGKIVEADSNAGHIGEVEGLLQSQDGINPGGFDYPLVSFREVDENGQTKEPARYLRYEAAPTQGDSRLVLEELSDSAAEQSQFRKDATFQAVPPLVSTEAEQTGELVSFKSITIGPATLNDGAFIRHLNSYLMVTDDSLNPPTFKEDATFRLFEHQADTRTSYTIGDIHPDGGIIFAVDDTGEHGWMVMQEDLGSFGFDDAFIGATDYSLRVGTVWSVPSVDQLKTIYDELHRTRNLGGFQNANYRSGTRSDYPHYPWRISFADGSKYGEAINNQTLVRLVRSF